ncbi:hypothetical protein SAMN04515692_11352 [Leifsonia sp. CL147]|nr:hypothetical protein SAMN04515694_11358 [Leifsonia sp. CL154]SFL80774.1 hypothetical protein SAMN04515692_11352 [Leifsonia sp. CL147]
MNTHVDHRGSRRVRSSVSDRLQRDQVQLFRCCPREQPGCSRVCDLDGKTASLRSAHIGFESLVQRAIAHLAAQLRCHVSDILHHSREDAHGICNGSWNAPIGCLCAQFDALSRGSDPVSDAIVEFAGKLPPGISLHFEQVAAETGSVPHGTGRETPPHDVMEDPSDHQAREPVNLSAPLGEWLDGGVEQYFRDDHADRRVAHCPGLLHSHRVIRRPALIEQVANWDIANRRYGAQSLAKGCQHFSCTAFVHRHRDHPGSIPEFKQSRIHDLPEDCGLFFAFHVDSPLPCDFVHVDFGPISPKRVDSKSNFSRTLIKTHHSAH